MIQKKNNHIVLVEAAKNLPIVQNLFKNKTKIWKDRALKLCYYMWSEEGDELYQNLLPSRRIVRIQKDFLDGYNPKNITSSSFYTEFENLYIETQYTAEYAIYLQWQKDADDFIGLLKNIKMDIANKSEKFQMLKEAKDVIELGLKLKEMTSKEFKFRKGKEQDRERLFEIPDAETEAQQ